MGFSLHEVLEGFLDKGQAWIHSSRQQEAEAKTQVFLEHGVNKGFYEPFLGGLGGVGEGGAKGLGFLPLVNRVDFFSHFFPRRACGA